MDSIMETSPRSKARVAGVFYVITFVGGVFALVYGRRAGVYFYAANVVASVAYIVVTLLFYDIFKPVSKSVSLLAALFSLAGSVIGTLSLFRVISFPINNLVFFGF